MYQIEKINETENPQETINFIESKRNWSISNQTYKIPPKEENEIMRTTNLSACKIYWRGKYLIIEHSDIIFYWDSFPYCFLKVAVEFIDLENPAQWKTIEKLITLRMAIRQTEVNCCGYVESMLIGKKLTLSLYNDFIRVARKQDLQHHGSHTF